MSLSFSFIWYDLYVGLYWSAASRALYLVPLPCCVFKLTFSRRGDNVIKPKGVPQ